jgi:hypothetical protein
MSGGHADTKGGSNSNWPLKTAHHTARDSKFRANRASVGRRKKTKILKGSATQTPWRIVVKT